MGTVHPSHSVQRLGRAGLETRLPTCGAGHLKIRGPGSSVEGQSLDLRHSYILASTNVFIAIHFEHFLVASMGSHKRKKR